MLDHQDQVPISQDYNQKPLQIYPQITSTEFTKACQTLERRFVAASRSPNTSYELQQDTIRSEPESGQAQRDADWGDKWDDVKFVSYHDGYVDGYGHEGMDELIIRTRGRGADSRAGESSSARDEREIEEKKDESSERGRSPNEEIELEFEDEDEDNNNVIRRVITDSDHGASARPAINFSVILSPTYRVPVLWFTFAHPSSSMVPGPIQVSDLEKAYAEIASPESKGTLQRTGVMGGISIANHPISDRPAFFIHPCNTPDALRMLNDGSGLGPFDYLLLWFGIVGSAVGLYVPARLAAR